MTDLQTHYDEAHELLAEAMAEIEALKKKIERMTAEYLETLRTAQHWADDICASALKEYLQEAIDAAMGESDE